MIFLLLFSSAGEDAREPAGRSGFLHSRGFWRLPLFLDGNAVKLAPETDAIQRVVSAASFCCPRFSTFFSPDGKCVIPFGVGELHYRLPFLRLLRSHPRVYTRGSPKRNSVRRWRTSLPPSIHSLFPTAYCLLPRPPIIDN